MSQIMQPSKKSALEILEDFGRADILVNNAGVTRDALAMRMSLEDWDAVINTNLRGAFSFTHAIVRAMTKQRSGRIINISSVIGLMGNAGQTNYAREQGRLDRLHQIARARTGEPQHHCQCSGAGLCHHRHDRRTLRSSQGYDSQQNPTRQDRNAGGNCRRGGIPCIAGSRLHYWPGAVCRWRYRDVSFCSHGSVTPRCGRISRVRVTARCTLPSLAFHDCNTAFGYQNRRRPREEIHKPCLRDRRTDASRKFEAANECRSNRVTCKRPSPQRSQISGWRNRSRRARSQTAVHSRGLRAVFESVYGGQTPLRGAMGLPDHDACY